MSVLTTSLSPPVVRRLTEMEKELRRESRTIYADTIKTVLDGAQPQAVPLTPVAGSPVERIDLTVFVQGKPFNLLVAADLTRDQVVEHALIHAHQYVLFHESHRWELRDAEGEILLAGRVTGFRTPLYLDPKPGVGG